MCKEYACLFFAALRQMKASLECDSIFSAVGLVNAYLSHRIGALAASMTFSTALLISGPIPSPGMSVTVWTLASPGLGTYMSVRACQK